MFNAPQQQQPPRAKPALREQAINPRDLLEVNPQQFNEIKNRHLSAVDVHRQLHPSIQEHNVNFDVSFIPPKKEVFSKTPVFLPMYDQRYTDLRNNVSMPTQPKNEIRRSYNVVPQGHVPVHYAQNGPVVITQHTTQPVVVNRVYQRVDGQVVHMPSQYQ